MEKLCDYGPLNIQDFQTFLEKSKEELNELWDKKVPHTGKRTDFDLIQHIGAGAFGKVILVRHIETGKHYAMKSMEKEKIVKKNIITQSKNEKLVLQCINFPFVIRLEFFFMDNSLIYFVMPFIEHGEMFQHLKKVGRFEEQLARFYGAQVILGLEYLHFLDIIYRDLKPENILIDHTGYLKVADFGFAKRLKGRTYTLCGTPEYIAPEIILNKGYGKSVDWWSLGILLFEMSSGRAPFYNKDQFKMYELAAALTYVMPKYFSAELKDLVKNILQTDLSKRFGNLRLGVNDIKDHMWFRPVNWLTLLNRQMPPPFIPKKESTDLKDMKKQDIVLKVSSKDQFEKEFMDF